MITNIHLSKTLSVLEFSLVLSNPKIRRIVLTTKTGPTSVCSLATGKDLTRCDAGDRRFEDHSIH